MIVSTLLSFGMILVVVWCVINPSPLKFLLEKVSPTKEFEPNENAIVTDKYTLYHHQGSKKLIVVFIGGAGLFSKIKTSYGFTNELDKHMKGKSDIVVFNYPVRFTNTIEYTMNFINDVLQDFVGHESYAEYYAVGFSFGTFLAGAFYQKEQSILKSEEMKVKKIGMRFNAFISINGVFKGEFKNKTISRLFSYYIMNGTHGSQHYNCNDMKIPKYVISSSRDFLLSQTHDFITENKDDTQFQIYEKELSHTFAQDTDTVESIDCITRISKFLLNLQPITTNYTYEL